MNLEKEITNQQCKFAYYFLSYIQFLISPPFLFFFYFLRLPKKNLESKNKQRHENFDDNNTSAKEKCTKENIITSGVVCGFLVSRG